MTATMIPDQPCRQESRLIARAPRRPHGPIFLKFDHFSEREQDHLPVRRFDDRRRP